MVGTLTEYFQNTFTNELTNTLFLALIFGLILADLRKYFPIEWVFKRFKVKSGFIKLILFPLYYLSLLTVGLLGVFLVVYFLWLIDFLL